jgi:UPF0755 protein
MSQFGLIPDSDEASSARAGRHHRRQQRRRHKRGRHSSRVAVVLSLLVVAAIIVGVVVVVQTVLSEVGDRLLAAPEDYPGPGRGSVVVVVQEGQSLSEIGATLTENGVVASTEAFVAASATNPDATSIQPGTYELAEQMAAVDALAILVDPANRVVDGVVVREGLRVEQTLDAFEEQAGMDRAALEAAVADTDQLGLPRYARGNPEGFLFPATYEVQPSTSEAEAIGALPETFATVAERIALEQRAADLGYSPREIVTVASIVQAEARLPEDFGKVARVIYNRLEDGDLLQMDSTVAYANDVYTVLTTDEQRAVDSPYNTYQVPGLPPGPINSPGEQALEAALDPTPGPWRFFVTVNLDTGETRYSRTFAEHQRNVAELQRWLAENPR